MGKRILVVEPSPTLRAILLMYFERDGHQTVLFEDYEAAVQALPRFQAEPPELAFVALDARHPASFRFLTPFRELYAHTKLMVMVPQEESGQLDVQNLLQAVQAIPLLKPFSIRDVLNLLADVVSETSTIPSSPSGERDGNA
jgi:DNA-binding response OmpR family regulator